jgi:hypothetical protein
VCVCVGDSTDLLQDRFAKELADAHTEETLVKFEQLMENAVDLEAVPEEYLIDAGYSADLQVHACLLPCMRCFLVQGPQSHFLWPHKEYIANKRNHTGALGLQ